jgi:hypothetical protein
MYHFDPLVIFTTLSYTTCEFFFVNFYVAELATTSLRRVVLRGNFQKLCVAHMIICHFGFYQYGDYLDKKIIVHSDVHLGWIETNANKILN